MIKKGMVCIAVLVLFVFVTGCIDYKAYEVPEEDLTGDVSLIDEIAEIEKELELLEEETEEEPSEEISAEEKLEEELAEEEEIEELIEEIEEESQEVEEEVIIPELEEETIAEPVEEEMQVITIDENKKVKLNVKVTDPDEDVVTYSFSPPLNEQGEWQTNYGDAGEYIVTIKATDNKLTTEKQVKMVVNRVNVPPIISELKDITVQEGETITFEPEVDDPNNDPVTVTVSEPLKNGVFSTDHTSAGEYQIKVVASDGELETEKTFTLKITDVNELPEITNLQDITTKEGETVRVEPTITDLDEDQITLTISEPVGDDGVWETSYTDHGEYFVTVTVNDGKDQVTQKIKITIEDVNMPPVIVDVSLG